MSRSNYILKFFSMCLNGHNLIYGGFFSDTLLIKHQNGSVLMKGVVLKSNI
jgi:hypothetical protein